MQPPETGKCPGFDVRNLSFGPRLVWALSVFVSLFFRNLDSVSIEFSTSMTADPGPYPQP